MRYRVEYDDDVSIVAEPEGQPSFAQIIEWANVERRSQGDRGTLTAIRIFALDGPDGERCVWTGPRARKPLPEPVPLLLFMAYSYVTQGASTEGYRPRTWFGNALIEMSAEPTTPDHIEHVQQLIEQQTDRTGVILLHWQQVGR